MDIDLKLAMLDAQAYYRGVRQRRQECGQRDVRPFFMSKKKRAWLDEQAEITRLQIELDRVRRELRAVEYGLEASRYAEESKEMQYRKLMKDCELSCIGLLLHIG